MSNPVIVTYSNYGYLDFAENFIKNVSKKAPNHKIIFYCLDQQIFNTLSAKYNQNNITFIKRFGDDITKEFTNYGTSSYAKLLQCKFSIIKHALETNDFILYLDCDVVFINEIKSQFYKLHKNFDIVCQSDAYPSTASNRSNIVICNGIMLIRNTEATHSFINKILKIQEEYPESHDQECVYMYFYVNNIENTNDLERITGLKLICASWNVFMAGIYVINSAGFPDDTTFLFHANHVVGKFPKIQLLKWVGEWYMADANQEK